MRRHVTTWQGVVLALVRFRRRSSRARRGVLAVITLLMVSSHALTLWSLPFLLGMLISMPLLCALVAIDTRRIRRINYGLRD